MLHITNARRTACAIYKGSLMAVLALLFSAMGMSVRAEEPPTKPLLRVDTKTHTGVIKDLAVDAKETFFVTCSLDGTLRMWDLASGNLQRTIHVPYGGRRHAVFRCDFA